MVISSNFVQVCNFPLSILQFSTFFGKILASIELLKFWTHNSKAMSKYKKTQYHSYLIANIRLPG